MAAKAFVGVTDSDWFSLLSRQPDIDEVNFWQPSPAGGFKALTPGDPFLFKLRGDNYVAGGGFFATYSVLPAQIAWEAFEIKNGAQSFKEMWDRIARYRHVPQGEYQFLEIGCIVLEQPFFFEPDERVPLPDWKPNIVRGKGYDLAVEPGLSMWADVRARIAATRVEPEDAIERVLEEAVRYGVPSLVRARLGQGSFRVLVTDAYQRACAVSGEKALPVLEAAHIVPYAKGGDHAVDNGLLLRSDVHRLFDRGYVTVTPDHRFEVSQRLRTEYHNGEEYFAWHGSPIALPSDRKLHPDPERLRWHNENLFVA